MMDKELQFALKLAEEMGIEFEDIENDFGPQIVIGGRMISEQESEKILSGKIQKNRNIKYSESYSDYGNLKNEGIVKTSMYFREKNSIILNDNLMNIENTEDVRFNNIKNSFNKSKNSSKEAA